MILLDTLLIAVAAILRMLGVLVCVLLTIDGLPAAVGPFAQTGGAAAGALGGFRRQAARTFVATCLNREPSPVPATSEPAPPNVPPSEDHP
jgi:hypothetical protein